MLRSLVFPLVASTEMAAGVRGDREEERTHLHSSSDPAPLDPDTLTPTHPPMRTSAGVRLSPCLAIHYRTDKGILRGPARRPTASPTFSSRLLVQNRGAHMVSTQASLTNNPKECRFGPRKSPSVLSTRLRMRNFLRFEGRSAKPTRIPRLKASLSSV